MANTEIRTMSHEVINFRVPAELKYHFEEAAYKNERTVSQQLRVLMLEFIALGTDWAPNEKDFNDVEKNISTSKVTRHVKVNKNFTRGK